MTEAPTGPSGHGTVDPPEPAMAKAYQPAEVEPAIYARWLEADVFAPDGAGSRAVAHARAVRHHHAAAQRDRRPPPRSRGPLGDRGPHGPSRAHAASPHAVAAGRRPRLDRGPVGAATRPRRRGHDARGARPRALPRADVALHGRDAARSSWASSDGSAARRTGAASASRWTRARRAPCGWPSSGSTRTASPTAARSSSTGAPAAARASPTSRSSARPPRAPSGRSATTSCRPGPRRARTAPRTETITVATTRPETLLGRHGRGGAPRGSRATRTLVGRTRAHPLRRPRRARHRRRDRGARVRHGRREDHAGPRSRLTSPPASVTACPWSTS